MFTTKVPHLMIPKQVFYFLKFLEETSNLRTISIFVRPNYAPHSLFIHLSSLGYTSSVDPLLAAAAAAATPPSLAPAPPPATAVTAQPPPPPMPSPRQLCLVCGRMAKQQQPAAAAAAAAFYDIGSRLPPTVADDAEEGAMSEESGIGKTIAQRLGDILRVTLPKKKLVPSEQICKKCFRQLTEIDYLEMQVLIFGNIGIYID